MFTVHVTVDGSTLIKIRSAIKIQIYSYASLSNDNDSHRHIIYSQGSDLNASYLSIDLVINCIGQSALF